MWDHEEREDDEDLGVEDVNSRNEGGRMYNFEIAKTNEQEEDVVSRPGFRVCS